MSPIMVSLLNPLPLISFQAPCASPDVGVLSWNQFPRKTLKWKALFQPLCTKLDCVLVSRGVVCFCRVSLCRKVKMSRPRSVPSSLLSHIIYVYSTTDGHSKGLPYTVDIRIQVCSFSAKYHFGMGQSKSKSARPEDNKCNKRNVWESTRRNEVCVILTQLQQKYSIGKRQFGTTDADWMVFFLILQLQGWWNKSVSNSKLMWNTWWSVTVWVMTALLGYKLQSQFDNSNGMLPGQIFVRRERKLYVKLYYIYRMWCWKDQKV